LNWLNGLNPTDRRGSAGGSTFGTTGTDSCIYGDVPDVARQEVAVRSRHRISLEARFQDQKAASKLLTTPFMLWHVDKSRSWPGPTRSMDLSLSKQEVGLVRPMRGAPASLVRANKSIRKPDTAASMLLRDGSKHGFQLTRHDESPRDCGNSGVLLRSVAPDFL
jgi:hypothetical protein